MTRKSNLFWLCMMAVALGACAPSEPQIIYVTVTATPQPTPRPLGRAMQIEILGRTAEIEDWQGGALTLNPNAVNRDLDFPDSMAILVHSDLWGSHFNDLQAGEIVTIVHEYGRQDYRVTGRLLYKAVRPFSAESDYIETQTGTRFTALEWAYHLYGQPGRLTMATCDLGGLFRQAIFAEPVP